MSGQQQPHLLQVAARDSAGEQSAAALEALRVREQISYNEALAARSAETAARLNARSTRELARATRQAAVLTLTASLIVLLATILGAILKALGFA